MLRPKYISETIPAGNKPETETETETLARIKTQRPTKEATPRWHLPIKINKMPFVQESDDIGPPASLSMKTLAVFTGDGD